MANPNGSDSKPQQKISSVIELLTRNTNELLENVPVQAQHEVDLGLGDSAFKVSQVTTKSVEVSPDGTSSTNFVSQDAKSFQQSYSRSFREVTTVVNDDIRLSLINTNRIFPRIVAGLQGPSYVYSWAQAMGLTQELDSALSAKVIGKLGEWFNDIWRDAANLCFATKDMPFLSYIHSYSVDRVKMLQKIELSYGQGIKQMQEAIREHQDQMVDVLSTIIADYELQKLGAGQEALAAANAKPLQEAANQLKADSKQLFNTTDFNSAIQKLKQYTDTIDTNNTTGYFRQKQINELLDSIAYGVKDYSVILSSVDHKSQVINSQNLVRKYMTRILNRNLSTVSDVLNYHVPKNGNYLQVKINEAQLNVNNFLWGNFTILPEHQGRFAKDKQQTLLTHQFDKQLRSEQMDQFLTVASTALFAQDGRQRPVFVKQVEKLTDRNAEHGGWKRVQQRIFISLIRCNEYMMKRAYRIDPRQEQHPAAPLYRDVFKAPEFNLFYAKTWSGKVGNILKEFARDGFDGFNFLWSQISTIVVHVFQHVFEILFSIYADFKAGLAPTAKIVVAMRSPLLPIHEPEADLEIKRHDQVPAWQKRLLGSEIGIRTLSFADNCRRIHASFTAHCKFTGLLPPDTASNLTAMRDESTHTAIASAKKDMKFHKSENLLSAAISGLEGFMDFFIRYYSTHPVIGCYLAAFYVVGAIAIVSPLPFGFGWFAAIAKGIGTAMSSGGMAQMISAGFTLWQLMLICSDTLFKAGDGIIGHQIKFLQNNWLKLIIGLAFFIAVGKLITLAHIPWLSAYLAEEAGSVAAFAYFTAGMKILMLSYEMLTSRVDERSFLNNFIHVVLQLVFMPVRLSLMLLSAVINFVAQALYSLVYITNGCGLATADLPKPRFDLSIHLLKRPIMDIVNKVVGSGYDLRDSTVRLTKLAYLALLLPVNFTYKTMTHHMLVVCAVLEKMGIKAATRAESTIKKADNAICAALSESIHEPVMGFFQSQRQVCERELKALHDAANGHIDSNAEFQDVTLNHENAVPVQLALFSTGQTF